LLGKIDISKQLGYLFGLGASFLFYETLKYGIEIIESKEQIIILNYILIVLQCFIIFFLIRSFSRIEKGGAA